MSTFITQAIEQSVRVLVLARPSRFLDSYIRELHRKQIDVEWIEPSALIGERVPELQAAAYYKICWILDDVQKGTAEADGVFQFLFNRTEPIVVISASLSSFPLTNWKQKKTGDDKLFAHLRQHLSALTLIVGVNVVDLAELFVSPFYFFFNSSGCRIV